MSEVPPDAAKSAGRKRRSRIVLVCLMALGALALLIAYPPDIERPESITFVGTAPTTFGTVVVTAGARADSRLWLCRNYAPVFEDAGGRARSLRRSAKVEANGSFRVTIDPREVGLGGPCRYTLGAVSLDLLEQDGLSPGQFVVSLRPPTRHRPGQELKVAPGGVSEVIDVCCQTEGSVSCAAEFRTLARWGEGRTVRVDVHGQAESCYPELKQVESYP